MFEVIILVLFPVFLHIFLKIYLKCGSDNFSRQLINLRNLSIIKSELLQHILFHEQCLYGFNRFIPSLSLGFQYYLSIFWCNNVDIVAFFSQRYVRHLTEPNKSLLCSLQLLKSLGCSWQKFLCQVYFGTSNHVSGNQFA